MKKRWLAICITLLIMNVVVASCGGSESEQVRKVKDVGVVSTEYYGDFNDFSLMKQLGMDANSSELAVIEDSSLTDAAQSLIEKGCKILIFCVDLDEYAEEIEQFKSDNPDVEVYEVDIDEAKDYYSNSYGEGSDNGTDSEGSGATIGMTERGVDTSTDSNGYSIEIILDTTDVIPASDWESIKNTFNSISSEQIDDFSEVINGGNINQDTASAIVGKITLRNATDGWDFTTDAPYEFKWLCPMINGKEGYNGADIFINHDFKYSLPGTAPLTVSKMTSNERTVPFIAILPDTVTPNNPEGEITVQVIVMGVMCDVSNAS